MKFKLTASHVTTWRQLRHFTAVHKSCPVASWDGKVSIECNGIAALHKCKSIRQSINFSSCFLQNRKFHRNDVLWPGTLSAM